jgi:hypothetical protein
MTAWWWDRELGQFDPRHGITLRQAIVTPLAPPVGNQPLLFHQQGEATHAHARRQLVRQSLPHGTDLHAFWRRRHGGENGVKLLFGDPFWPVADYMSLKARMRQIKSIYLTQKRFVSHNFHFFANAPVTGGVVGCRN